MFVSRKNGGDSIDEIASVIFVVIWVKSSFASLVLDL